MKRNIYLASLLSILSASAFSQSVFTAIDTTFHTRTIVVPSSPVKYHILCVATDSIAHNNDGTVFGPVKEWADFTGYIGINGSSDSGYVVINNELKINHPDGKDGGGMTQFKVKKDNLGNWKVATQTKGSNTNVRYVNIDFSPVGGTVANCGGWMTPWNTVLTAEEWQQASNIDLNKTSSSAAANSGVRDTTDYTIPSGNGVFSGKTLKRFQNMNHIVEVNPATAQVVKKHYSMGRFEHEQAYVMDDQKTVYLTDDNQPAVFFKFVANTAGDLSSGQLYAYKQGATANDAGTWVTVNNTSDGNAAQADSLLIARTVALRKGATMYTRHEWLTYVNGKFYITETGRDNSGTGFTAASTKYNGILAHHLELLDQADGNNDNVVIDYYGRILEFDPSTNKMRVFLEGGPTNNGSVNLKTHLSNPDGLTHVTVNGKTYLVIQEDLNGQTYGRNANYTPFGNTHTICEAYWLDLSISNPTLNDLKRFVIGPKGTEITGGCFTPDGKTFFVNFQHPNTSNPSPWNRSVTVAITGYDQLTSSVEPFQFEKTVGFQIYPNPASRTLHFNKMEDVALYDVKGIRVKVARNVDELDISDLLPGVYFVQTLKNEVIRIVIE